MDRKFERVATAGAVDMEPVTNLGSRIKPFVWVFVNEMIQYE